MSRIYKKWICDNCKTEIEYYISFGHPDEDFDYKWKCGECGHVNTLHVPAMPKDKKQSFLKNFLRGILCLRK